jgi:transposase
MQGKKARQEKLFTNFQLSERVPEDNFYRRLTEKLDLCFLYPLTAKYYGSEGPPSVDVVVFFKLILVGYLENLNSDRRIVAHSSMRLDILYFVGYDLDEALPWHSTLSRTRQLFGQEVFTALFLKVLGLCIEKGMVGGKRQAVDSAYIKANASMDSLLEKEVLEDGKIFTNELDQNDKEKQGMRLLNKESDLSKKVRAQKKKTVEGRQKWLEKVCKGRPHSKSPKSVEEQQRKRNKFLSNDTHFSSTDPDARISVKPGKPRQLTYSAQTTVDTKKHVITSILADFSDLRDSQSMKKILNQTRCNLKHFKLDMKELLADTGFSSGESLRYLKFWNIIGYIPNFPLYKNNRQGFTFDAEKNQYTCQNEKILTYKGIKTNKIHDCSYHAYFTKSSDCKNCKLKTSCIGKLHVKKITDSVDKPLYDEMYERLQTKKAKRYAKLRSSTVEPVLGSLINYTGLRKIGTLGIEQANKVMISAAIAYNLRKWLKYNPRTNNKAETKAKEHPNLKNDYYNVFWVTLENLFCKIILIVYPKTNNPKLFIDFK